MRLTRTTTLLMLKYCTWSSKILCAAFVVDSNADVVRHQFSLPSMINKLKARICRGIPSFRAAHNPLKVATNKLMYRDGSRKYYGHTPTAINDP